MTERPHDDFVDALRDAEAHVLEQRPARHDHQRALLGSMLERERARPARRLRAWLLGGASSFAATTAALALAWPFLTAPSTPETVAPSPVAENTPTPTPAPSPLATLGLASDTCEASVASDGDVSFPSGCDASWTALRSTLIIDSPSTLSRLDGDDGFAVRRGQVTFDIDPKRPAARVVRVAVSGGVIEVLGTRFTVVEEGDRGEVTLHRGAIRFVPESGEPHTLEPGDSHRWGQASAALDTLVPPADTPERAAPRTPRRPRVITRTHRDTLAPEDLSRLHELRRLGRHDDALALLRDLSRKDLDRSTLEVLNYERGELLGLQGKTKAACSHWKRHLRRYPKGAYRREVRAHSERLGCRK